ncbi:MAG: alpha-E domain-containing protein, partial [Burkholderiales bacterium]
DYCDPLELRVDSALGVPGLIEAVRRGNVLVTNSLGANLPESGALLGFLPAICEHLLGEPLKMPSVGTWWCGEPAALEEVIDRLDEFIIRPAFPQLRQFPVFGQDVQGVQRQQLIDRMRARPQQYVAQELVRLSQAPVWRSRPEGLGASAIGLRVFACATPDGYVVMPGGLTRVATGQDARVITMQQGGSSKDTWVQAAGKIDTVTLLHRSTDSSDLIREDTHLSSRMAENLYWFGRHIERCNNICRLMRAALDYLFTNQPDDRSSEWPAIQWLCAFFYLIPGDMAIQIRTQNQDQGQLPGLEHATIISDEQIESVLLQAIVSLDVPGLASQLQQLHRAASHLRERVSLDNWRTLNQMTQRLEGAQDVPSPADALAILDEVTASLMGMAGFAMDGMTRDKGWSFFSGGRRIERLQFLCRVLERALRMDVDSSLEWLLELSDSIVTYRSRYMSQPEWLRVLDLLLLDDSNPRSVVFQLKGLLKYLKKLADSYGSFGEEILLPLLAELQGLSVADLRCGSARLIDLVERINRTSHALSEQIAVRFFSYTGANLYGTSKA